MTGFSWRRSEPLWAPSASESLSVCLSTGLCVCMSVCLPASTSPFPKTLLFWTLHTTCRLSPSALPSLPRQSQSLHTTCRLSPSAVSSLPLQSQRAPRVPQGDRQRPRPPPPADLHLSHALREGHVAPTGCHLLPLCCVHTRDTPLPRQPSDRWRTTRGLYGES